MGWVLPSFNAGAAIPVVDGAAAEVASLIASPIPLKSEDAAAKASGAAIRKDDILGSIQTTGMTNQGNESSRQARKILRAVGAIVAISAIYPRPHRRCVSATPVIFAR